MPYDTPYNRMIARNQQHTDDEYADYRAYSNQNYLRDGSMGDARGNLRLFPKMVQREYYSPLDYSGGITHRNMEGDGGPLGRQFNSIALGEDTRRQHNKSAMYSPVRPIGSGSSGGFRYAREDDRHYSSSEESCSDDEDLDAMYGGGVPSHPQLLKHLAKMKLPHDVHQEVIEWLEEMEKSGRGLEGRGGLWDWIKSAAKKVGSFVADNIKPIAKFAMPFIKKIPGVGSAVEAASTAAKMIPGASNVLGEYGLGYSGGSEVYVPTPERGSHLSDVRSGGSLMSFVSGLSDADRERMDQERLHPDLKKKRLEAEKRKKDEEDKKKKAASITVAPQLSSSQPFIASGGSIADSIKQIGKNVSNSEKKGREALKREAFNKAEAEKRQATGGARIMMETNENPLIGVPMRKPGYMKSTGLHFQGASLGAGASGGKKRGRPRKVGGSVMGGPSNDPVNRGKITGGRKTGSALFKKKGTFPLETKPGEPPTESQIVTNGELGQGRRKKGGADKAEPTYQAIAPQRLRLESRSAPKPHQQFTVEPTHASREATTAGPAPPKPALPRDLPPKPKKKKSPPPEFSAPEDVDSGMVESGFGVRRGGKLKTLLPGSSFSGGKKTSPWIAHCKAYASAHGVSYKQAMKDAKASYKK